MQKKLHISQDSRILMIFCPLSTLILDMRNCFAGAPRGNADEGEPEAKESLFEEESEISYSLPSINYDVWAEEDESGSYFSSM